MKLRTKLVLSFLGLAVIPLAAITLYSYHSSLQALRTAAREESSAMAADMGSRMEEVGEDLRRQLERFAAFEFRRVMALDPKERKAAMEALESRLKAQMGDYASFLKSLQFTPSSSPRPIPPPPPPPLRVDGTPKAAAEKTNAFSITLAADGSPPAVNTTGNDRTISLPPFPTGRFNTEVRSGSELVGNVSAEISSHRLLFHVLRRTQPRQGEIPFAMDTDGKLYATNPEDLKKLEALNPKATRNTPDGGQHAVTLNNWVVVTRKDSQSGLTFGIARPLADRLGDLRRTAAKNMGYGLGLVVLALIGIVPLSGRMTRNLNVLTKGAEDLARGNLQARVPITSKDEFGVLAQAFNRMAQDLSEQQQQLLEQERVRKELEMCRRIQEELLPRNPLRSGIVEVKGVSIPAREVGGDFFNYFPMPGDTMALLIGDVSGKGLPAALLMANLQATIQARLPLELDLARMAAQLNDEIVANNAESYLTLFLAVLDPQSLRLRYINAGHNPQFLLHADGSTERLTSTGRPIGLLGNSDFEEKSLLLKPGESLFFYTDGLIESINAAGEEFGMQRLESLLAGERSKGLEGILADIEKAVRDYRGSVDPIDDATMMLLKIG